MHWLLLALAVAFEVAGTVAMKLSDGLRRPGWAAAMLAAYVVCFVLVSLSVRRIELGVAYAIWAGAGTALVAGLGVVAFDEPLTALKVAGLVLVVLGVVALNLSGVSR